MCEYRHVECELTYCGTTRTFHHPLYGDYHLDSLLKTLTDASCDETIERGETIERHDRMSSHYPPDDALLKLRKDHLSAIIRIGEIGHVCDHSKTYVQTIIHNATMDPGMPCLEILFLVAKECPGVVQTNIRDLSSIITEIIIDNTFKPVREYMRMARMLGYDPSDPFCLWNVTWEIISGEHKDRKERCEEFLYDVFENDDVSPFDVRLLDAFYETEADRHFSDPHVFHKVLDNMKRVYSLYTSRSLFDRLWEALRGWES